MSPDPGIEVREARASDLDDVAAVFLACWQTSYRGILPDRVLDVFDAERARNLWSRTILTPPADATIFVAEQAGRGVVGVARIGRDPHETTAGHLFSLYVHPDTQGLGVGARLLAAVDARFRDAGLGEATLWVFAANAPSRRFYERRGWQPDGGARVESQFGEPELRLRRSLADATASSASVPGHPAAAAEGSR